MTMGDDLWRVDAMWRATDLTRAYLAQDRARVAACLADLNTDQLNHVLTWLILDYDVLFDGLGKPSMAAGELAALAPMETELAATAALRRVARGETGLAHAVEGLALQVQVHTMAICTAVILLGALGRTRALEHVTAAAMETSQLGHFRPCGTG